MIENWPNDRLSPLGRLLLWPSGALDRLVGERVQRSGFVLFMGWAAGAPDTPRWVVLDIGVLASLWTVLLIAAHRIERRRAA